MLPPTADVVDVDKIGRLAATLEVLIGDLWAPLRKVFGSLLEPGAMQPALDEVQEGLQLIPVQRDEGIVPVFRVGDVREPPAHRRGDPAG